MPTSLILSVLLHIIVLSAVLFNFSTSATLDANHQPVIVELVSPSDLTKVKAGKKDVAEKDAAPSASAPAAEKKPDQPAPKAPEPKPVDKPAEKQAVAPPPPAKQETAKAEPPKPELPKPEPPNPKPPEPPKAAQPEPKPEPEKKVAAAKPEPLPEPKREDGVKPEPKPEPKKAEAKPKKPEPKPEPKPEHKQEAKAEPKPERDNTPFRDRISRPAEASGRGAGEAPARAPGANQAGIRPGPHPGAAKPRSEGGRSCGAGRPQGALAQAVEPSGPGGGRGPARAASRDLWRAQRPGCPHVGKRMDLFRVADLALLGAADRRAGRRGDHREDAHLVEQGRHAGGHAGPSRILAPRPSSMPPPMPPCAPCSNASLTRCRRPSSASGKT